MNTELALRAIEALEPYARRLIEQAERKGPAYRTRWFLALQQAELVIAAYDAPGELTAEPPEGASSWQINLL